jgi:hypothetical protein
VALVLACVGLYGLMALGARRDQVMWLVLGETLWLGIAAGVPLSLWAAGYAKSPLFGIS